MEPEIEGIEAFMGSRVHETLQRLYRDVMEGVLSKGSGLDGYDLLTFYKKSWEENWHENVNIVKKQYTPGYYFNIGKKCIVDYYSHYYPFTDSRMLGIEQVIYIFIEGYELIGYIDRISLKEDNLYEIHDYKTSHYLPAFQSFKKDRQLSLYQIGISERMKGDGVFDLVWHYLAHDKEIRIRRTEEELNKVKGDIVAVIHRIENTEEFPARKSGLCPWCDFNPICHDDFKR